MSKTEFSRMEEHDRQELIQDILDNLLYNEESCDKIIKFVKELPKIASIQGLIIGGKNTGVPIRTVKL